MSKINGGTIILKHTYLLFALIAFFLSAQGAHADTIYPTNNPVAASGATEFNWQDLWGTIHLNSFADGLNDPGAPSSDDGKMPLVSGLISTYLGTHAASQNNSLDNGIKYDIKNSVVNCMSVSLPTWPIKHLDYGNTGYDYSDGYVCVGSLPPRSGSTHTVVYMPIYDSRSNDTRDNDITGTHTGCQQQIVNRCVSDIHECRNGPTDGAGYKHPVSHVFSPQEVSDLGNPSALPSTYYRFTKILTTGPRETAKPSPIPLPYFINLVENSFDCSGWIARTSTQIENILDCNFENAHSLKARCESDIALPDITNIVVTEATVTSGTSTIITTGTVTTFTHQDPTQCHCRFSYWQNKTCYNYDYTPVTSSTFALSSTNPPSSDFVPLDQAPIEIIDVTRTSDYTTYLQRLKSYEVTDNEANEDITGFIIVDPADFFDLSHYAGGKYNSNYDLATFKTPDTCPILGVGQYDAICDPDAGCNTPIYGKGAQTHFSDIEGHTYTYNDYSLKWSGYVKKWAFISPTQYWQNVSDRKNIGGGPLYLSGQSLNSNPILMITRDEEYCEDREMISGSLKFSSLDTQHEQETDMPCIQYLQYQFNSENNQYSFTDLFSPMAEPDISPVPFYSVKYNYDIDADGKPLITSPLRGTGPSIDIDGNVTSGSFLSFLDSTILLSHGGNALQSADYSGTVPIFDTLTGKRISGPVFSSNPIDETLVKPEERNQQTAGEYLGYDPETKRVDTTTGAGIRIKPGTSVIVRLLQSMDIDIDRTTENPTATCETMNSLNPVMATDTVCMDCFVITHAPTGDDIFITTNSPEEFQSFVTAAGKNHNSIPNLKVRKCDSWYQVNKEVARPVLGAEAAFENGTDSWVGKLKCSELTVQPTCNHTKIITAQRYCQLENGTMGSCNDCLSIEETENDKTFSNFLNAAAANGGSIEDGQGKVMVNPYDGRSNKCYYSASCFAPKGAGCPLPGLPGHIFCLAPDTKIKMADGSEKTIDKIKAGEDVIAFEAKHSKQNVLKTAKVKATAITEDQKILKINDLKITPLHKVVLASGRAVKALGIKIGDKILKQDGTFETVIRIEKDLPPITVYNLVLEDGSDGYIANGLRVLSYPILKGMDKDKNKNKSINKDKDNNNNKDKDKDKDKEINKNKGSLSTK